MFKHVNIHQDSRSRYKPAAVASDSKHRTEGIGVCFGDTLRVIYFFKHGKESCIYHAKSGPLSNQFLGMKVAECSYLFASFW